MAERFRFFDSIAGTDDRYYTADEFAEYFRQFIRNGIFGGGENLWTSTDGSNMKTFIKPGYAWLEGYLYKIDTENLYLEHNTADPEFDRVDRVVIRLDKTLENRYIKAFILEGAAAAVPSPPALTRNDNIYEISLAQVKIMAGKSYIETFQITDERLDNTVCGLATHLFQQIDTTEIFNQFQSWLVSKTSEPDGDFYSEWKNWFEMIQDTTNLVPKPQFDAHLSDYVRQPGYGVTAGSANTYTINLNPAPTAYIDGMGIVIKIHSANTGASTVNVDGLGAKAIIDGKGNAVTSGKLRLNGTYSLKYNSTSGNFILQGSDSSGNAIPADLLAGKTASTDAGDITGTMTDYGNFEPDSIVAPYMYNGYVYMRPPSGRFSGGIASNVKYVQADCIAANIVKGKVINGVTGTANKLVITVGNTPIAGNVNQNTTITNTSMMKKVEVTIYMSGTYRFMWGLVEYTSGTVYGQLYINDVGVGPLRTATETTYYSEEFTVNAGDKVSIYARVSGGQSYVSKLTANIDCSSIAVGTLG